MKTRLKSFRVYKKTAALQLNPSEDLENVFLEIANGIKGVKLTKGARPYDWDNKISFKLGQNDLLPLIDTLSIVKTAFYKSKLSTEPDKFDKWNEAMYKPKGEALKLFHKSGNGDTCTLTLKPNAAKYGGGFVMSLWKKKDGKTLSCQIPLSPPEIIGCLITLEKPFRAFYPPKQSGN